MMDLTDAEFMALMGDLNKYLEAKKVFIKNPTRFADVQHATEIAKQLFKGMEIALKDDPLQMGALILCINGFDITVRGEREIKLFQELIDKADNFEIYPAGNESVKFAILFNNALIRLPQGK